MVSRMSFNFEDAEMDYFSAAVDYIDVVESQPRLPPELLDVVNAPAQKASNGTRGMAAPLNSSGGELMRGEGLCQGPLPDTSNLSFLLPVSLGWPSFFPLSTFFFLASLPASAKELEAPEMPEEQPFFSQIHNKWREVGEKLRPVHE